MPWTPLAARFATLPLILSGPIVRRTEPDNVTIWVAVKEPCTVTLRIYERDDRGDLTERFLGTRHTVRLGDHLHLVAVTARAGIDDHPLKWGQFYYYDLFFETGRPPERHVPPTAASLRTPGILNQDPESASDLQRLVYAGHPLPSFVLPPPDLDKLRIMHGSCRNPHGKGREALSTVDLIMERTTHSPAERPQLLFLTGDQIYADDMAAPLLFALIDAGDYLREGNEHEVLPIVEQRARWLPPGDRTAVVTDMARFTTTTPESHLLSLAEYCAMYLFTWSDVPWPDDFPSVQDLLDSYPAEKPDRSTAQKRVARIYNQQVEQLSEFRAKLPNVRRALANIATYMIFDDHDVTDDWYLDGAWCKAVLDSALGRRIIRNAMLAYALFQGWGNDPDQFEAANGQALLNAVTAWRGDEMDPDAATITSRLGIPNAFSGYGELEVSGQALHWHYTLEGPRYQVIVLDTRTQRIYPRPHAAPGLLSSKAMEKQIIATDAEIAIVISATPILAVRFVSRLQFWLKIWKDNYDLELESWTLERETLQGALRALGQLEQVLVLSGDVHYGFGSSLEYWEYTNASTKTAKIVNYTSSALKNETSGVQKIALILGSPRLFHLFSRGELPTLELFAWDSAHGNRQVVHQALDAIREGWMRFWWAGPRLIAVLRSPFALMLPAQGWPAHIFDHYPPGRRYRLRYLRNTHQPDEQTTEAQPEPQSGITTLSAKQINRKSSLETLTDVEMRAKQAGHVVRAAISGRDRLVREARKRRDIWLSKWIAGQNIVWEANIGDIRFDWAQKEVIQSLWRYHPDDPHNPAPLTEYRESLEPPEIETAPSLP